MNPDELVFGFIQYIVFLLSTTCHEASHALIAKLGGDTTASEGGQASLNPLPHIRREPFGMVVMPLLGIVSKSGLIGWASAPYDPVWSEQHPKRAAWMSLAGPGANFSIAIIAGLLMRMGLAVHLFVPGAISTAHIVRGGSSEAVQGLAVILSVFFSLNILLGVFNLLPFPPLDGYGVLGLFTSENGARKLQQLRTKLRGFSIIGLLLGWRLLDQFYAPLLTWGVRGIYAFYRFS